MRRIAAILLILLAAACTTNQKRRGLDSPALSPTPQKSAGRAICDLSAPNAADQWKLFWVAGMKKESRLFASGGALHMVSNDSAGLYYYTGKPLFEPGREPLLSWRWRVSALLPDATPLAPEFDNFPARLLVGFDSGWDDADVVALQWKKKVEDGIGQTPPPRGICYTFGGRLPQSEAVDALFGQGRIAVINLRSRESEPNRWYEEVRDVAADYKAIFGKAAPPVTAIAVAADTDKVHATVNTDFAEFRVYGPEAYSQFSQDLTAPPQREWSNAAAWVFGGALLLVLASGAWLASRFRGKPESAGSSQGGN